MAKNPGTGIKVGTHFSPRFKRPLDDRFQFDTIAEMKSFPEGALYDSVQTYNTETKKFYQYFSTNTIDVTLGRWREVESVDSKQDVIQYDVLPTPSEAYIDKVFQYVGPITVNPDRKTGGFYQCKETSTNVYEWVELQPEVESIQVQQLPTASVKYLNKIYQYIGESVLAGYQKGYFYICVEDEAHPGSHKWKQKNVQPSSEGGSTLERDIKANVDVGGVTSGKLFEEGMSITDVLESILVKPVYQKVTLTLSENSLQKKGTSLSSVDMIAAIVKGDTPITDAKYYVNSVLVDTKDETTDPTIVNGGTFTCSYETEIDTDTEFKVDVMAGDHLETAKKIIKFINPYYYGNSNTAIISDFTGLTEDLSDKDLEKEVVYTATAEYLIFAYDSSYGLLTSIKDGNNFENINAFDRSSLEVDGQVYNVYISHKLITCNDFKYIFKI